MRFVKMHGCGNDYVYLDAVTDPAIESLTRRNDWPRLVGRMSDRHKGIGGDGVILVCRPGRGADARMRMFNADGSESEMCGNGVRCVAKFAHDRLGIRTNPMRVQTGRGVLSIAYRTARGRLVEATVDMGRPILDLRTIGVHRSRLAGRGTSPHWIIESAGAAFVGVFVSMGNPHMVIFEPWFGGTRDLTAAQVRSARLDEFGPILERHPAFPRRMNIHIAAPISRQRIVMRTWERGAGLTQACGTGACATAVAAAISGRCGHQVRIDVPGGSLDIRWDKASGHVHMTGEAVDVFDGEYP